MKTRIDFVLSTRARGDHTVIAGGHFDDGATVSCGGAVVPPHRPQGSCDITYRLAAGDRMCRGNIARHGASYATYNSSPSTQVLRQSERQDPGHWR